MAFKFDGTTSFKTALTYGGARPSLFEFTVSGAPSGVSASLSDVHFFCNVTEIPPLTLTPIERQYFGRTVKIPGDLVFADLSTTIMNTEKYNVRNEVEKWMEAINDTGTGYSKTAANFGTGTAELKHYQKDGTVTMTYKFIDIWPTTVAEIPLSYDTASDIETFDVTWAYNYYTSTGGTVTTSYATQT